MQSLFEGSDESPGFEGLGVIPGRVTRFNGIGEHGVIIRVPQMGWNGVSAVRDSVILENVKPNDAVCNMDREFHQSRKIVNKCCDTKVQNLFRCTLSTLSALSLR